MVRSGFLRTRNPNRPPKGAPVVDHPLETTDVVAQIPRSVSLKPLVRGTYSGGTTGPAPKEPAPAHSEAYRRLVASLPCYYCRIEGRSQAAHPNSGKAKGVKLSDVDCFPLCADSPGFVGCHSQFDQYKLTPKGDEMRAFEERAANWTRQQLASYIEQMGT